MAQSIYAPIQTGSLSEIASAPFREREKNIATKIAYTDKSVSESGIDELSGAGLAPNMAQVVNPWINAIKNNMTEGYYTNDMSKVNEAKAQAKELQAFISSGKIATAAANNSYLLGEKNQWRGMSLDEQSGKDAYSATTIAPINIDFSPSGYPVLKSDDGQYKPMMEYSGLNPQNYFMVTEASDLGANWDPRIPLDKHKTYITGAQTQAQATEQLNSRFEDDYRLGSVNDDDIAIHYLVSSNQIDPENAGTDYALMKIQALRNDETLMAKALESYRNSYIDAGLTDWQAERQASLAAASKSEAAKAPKYTTQRVTIEVDGNRVPVTQYVTSSTFNYGDTKIQTPYQSADGRWYGDIVATKKQGSRTIEEKTTRELSTPEVNFITGQLNLKGASTTGRATRAAGRM